VRRSAFRFWLRYFQTQRPEGARPVFNELPEGVVPFGFPFRGDGAAEMIRKLRRERIEAYWWPDLPHQLRDQAIEKLSIIPTHTLP
jgi:hypothetical protein